MKTDTTEKGLESLIVRAMTGRNVLLTVPKEYIDAAKVDGCGEIRTLLRVVVPMIRPAIAAVALFQFFYAWNDYFGPQVYVGPNPGNWTLALGLETSVERRILRANACRLFGWND